MAHKSQVWVADEEEAFVRAQILNEKDDGTTIVQVEGRMGDMTLPTEDCHKVNPDSQDGGALRPAPARCPPPRRAQPRSAPLWLVLAPPTRVLAIKRMPLALLA